MRKASYHEQKKWLRLYQEKGVYNFYLTRYKPELGDPEIRERLKRAVETRPTGSERGGKPKARTAPAQAVKRPS